MATRLATQSFVVGTTGNSAQARSGNISPDPSDECTSETSQTGLIIPGTTNSVELQQTIQQVAVIDVSALETSDASNESSVGTSSVQVATQVAVVQGQRDSHTPLLTASPHFITVTEGTVRSYAPLTTVNPVVPSEETVGTHSTYVQYVETTDLYGTGGPSQAQMAYPVYTVGGDYTSTAQQQYFGSATYAGAAATASATVTSGGHYIVPNMTADGETIIGTLPDSRSSPQANNVDVVSSYLNAAQPSSQDSEAVPLVNPTRVSPVTVQWLLSNYETAEGVSLPRSTLYAHYSRHCSENKIDPVNAASFGKLIRSVFMGLRTRRLGTRGNSKYHYYGIRIKPGSELNMLEESSPSADSSFTNENTDCVPPGRPPAGPTKSQHRRPLTKADHYDGSAQYLGDGAHAIPSFPELEFKDELLPDDCSLDDVDTLRSIYREHCEAFLDAILGLEFNTIESLWREFWRSNNNNNGDECEEEKYLSKTKLYALCNCEPVQLFVLQIDYMFYQNIVEVLLPDVLRPIPSTLTQAIRNFAKGLENWLSAAMAGLPSALVEGKMTAVAAFGQTLRRYTSLNHLAQAARAVLQNGTQISQMLSDLNRVDFHNVQEQAAYVCQCDTIIVKALEEDFKYTLQQQNNLEQWATWLKTVMSNALQPFEGKPTYPKAARQFLLKWSFYSSMVIRDLTLRSAASFGSFHLIRLLYDEYMFYLVEHQIARSTGTTAIAVMAEVMRDQVSAHQFTPKPESPTGKRIRLS